MEPHYKGNVPGCLETSLEQKSSDKFKKTFKTLSPRSNVIKLFMDVNNKLYCFSLASCSSLVYCLWARPGAYPRVEHLKGSSIGKAPVLRRNI